MKWIYFLITIETQVLQSLIGKLDPANALKFKEQFKDSIYIRRLELPTVIITEFYAESLIAIPVEYLFENRGEWDLGEHQIWDRLQPMEVPRDRSHSEFGQ